MNIEELKLMREEILSGNYESIDDFIPDKSACDLLFDYCNDHLDEVAINYLGKLITYRELKEKIIEVSNAYLKLGVKENDIVAISSLTTPEAIINFYALNNINAKVQLINATISKDVLKKQLESTKPKAIVLLNLFYNHEMKTLIEEENIEKVITISLVDSLPILFYDKIMLNLIEKIKGNSRIIENNERCLTWKEFLKIGELSKNRNFPKGSKNNHAAIAYTSGTTGEPKGPIATNGGLNAMVIQLALTENRIKKGDSIINTLPIWIFYSLVNSIHEPLCLGVTVDIDPLFQPKQIMKRLKQFKFNHWNTIPTQVEYFCTNSSKRYYPYIRGVKTFTSGGDFLNPSIQKKGTEIIKSSGSDSFCGSGYGQSELLGCFSYQYDENGTFGSVGKPLIGNKFKIVDLETGELLTENQTGELYVCSPCLMEEYYNDQEETAKVLIQDEDGIKWYKTGDLAHYNSNGELFIDGRMRRIEIAIDDNGVPTKIFPDKVKMLISENELVDKCEIITINDQKKIKKIIAFVVPKNKSQSTNDLISILDYFCHQHLDNYTCPVDYVIVDTIPLTSNNKSDIKKLEQQYVEINKGSKRKIKIKRRKII